MASNALPSPPAEIHHRPEHGVLRMALVKLVADQIIPRLFGRSATPDVNDAILGDAGGLRLRKAGHQHGRAHIDGRIGHHQLVVGPGDQPVVRRRRRDLLRAEAPLQPGIGIFRRHLRIGRPQLAGFRHRLARGLAPMRRGRGFVERIDGDRPEHAELDRHRLLERGAALRLFHVMRERRPRQIDLGAFRLGRGRLRLGAADRGDAAFAARDALGGLMQISDRALAADRAVIEVRRLDAEPAGKLLLRIAVAPAQEIDDVERADVAEQFAARVRFGALQRFFQQGQRLEAVARSPSAGR